MFDPSNFCNGSAWFVDFKTSRMWNVACRMSIYVSSSTSDVVLVGAIKTIIATTKF